MKRWFYCLSVCLSIVLVSCQTGIKQQKNTSTKNYCQYVNPFVGTGGHGHTYPGAVLPFGMVQLSPDTRNDNSWDGCSGYHYSDSAIVGFSHTHLSGVGVPEYCDILFLPHTGTISLNAGSREMPQTGYRSLFRHETEIAEPGYYKVTLDDYNVDVELTATTRVGMQRYTFKGNAEPKVLIDLIHRDEVISSSIRALNKSLINGYRHSKDWAGRQKLFFATEFSVPFESVQYFKNGEKIEGDDISGDAIQAMFTFPVDAKEILVKTALSSVNEEGAQNNLNEELNHWDFNAVRQQAHTAWNQNLRKIEVESNSTKDLTNFYTSWYHCMLTPNTYSDVDGKYRGMDDKIHMAEGYTHYTVFSLWDTFRALHPLLSITHPKETRDFVCSIIDKGEQFGTYPMWELAENDTRCMIGYHAVSLIADAYSKGITDFDAKKALKLMIATSSKDWRGLKDYRELGFVPSDKSSQSVSKTLEYAYDDWCISEFAKAIGENEIAEDYLRRSLLYKNCFDTSSGFMRGKLSNGEWVKDFDPSTVGYHYTEGNSFQYSFFVPHDVYGLMNLKGGEKVFEHWLNSLYETPISEELHENSDVSGLIGNYAHGNEPSHHITWLYAWVNNYNQLTNRIREILKTQYQPIPGGISGNEDCGQMSAWYVMSASGLYPVCPGKDEYVWGLPYFNRVTFHLDNGKHFRIKTDGKSLADNGVYPTANKLNNKTNISILHHADLINGGEMRITTGDNSGSFNLPVNEMNQDITDCVFLKEGDKYFLNKTTIELSCATEGAKIYYTLDGSNPDSTKTLYTTSFTISKTCDFKSRAYANNMEPGYLTQIPFIKSDHSNRVHLSDLKEGLNCKYYEGIYRSIYDFALDSPVKSEVVSNFKQGINDRDEWFALSFSGYINIEKEGLYQFAVTMNDGGALKIDGNELFESDGRKEKAMTQYGFIWLSTGLHPVKFDFYQCSDEFKLDFKWKVQGEKLASIPSKFLLH